MHDGEALLALVDAIGTPWGVGIIVVIGVLVILFGLPLLERGRKPHRSWRRRSDR